MGRAGSVILHQVVPRTRVGKAGIVMPRTLPTTFKGESDEDVQERPVGAAAPGRGGEERARRGDEPSRGGHVVRNHGQDGAQVGRALLGSRPRRPRGPLIEAPPVAQARAGACRRADRLLATPSPDRHPHCRGDRRLAGHAVRVLKRAGLSRIKDPEPEEPAHRYEHNNPGDMIHLDVKMPVRFVRPGHRAIGTRVGRRQGSGWEFAHTCVDDASRVACGDLFLNERQESTAECLRASVACYKRLGVSVRR